MNHTEFSLEQELALRILSIQITNNTDIAKLQDDLIESIETILIKHKNLQNIYCFPSEDNNETDSFIKANSTLASESGVEATIWSYIDNIRRNHDLEELQTLLIEANKICMMQENYTRYLAQYISDHQSTI